MQFELYRSPKADAPGFAADTAPDEVARMLQDLEAAGVVSVLLSVSAGVVQLRRFAREITPSFRGASSAHAAE